MKILSQHIQKVIDFANSKSVSRAAKIRKWIILSRDLSVSTGEITPTFKLKRPKVEKHFKNEIEAIYMNPSL